MTAFALTFTTAGLDKFTAAQLGADIDLAIATVGVTAAVFVSAPTLTAVPGEIKRISTISGVTLPNSIVHMTMRDLSGDSYTVRGFGLYLADGTLFAVYSQAGVILEKSSVSTTLLAIDIKFPTDDVSTITFGDANFIYPPATEANKGVAEIATQAEVDAGTDAERIVTPSKLAARLTAVLQGLVGSARKVLTTGLASGGGDLTADRTINVPKASAADVQAGTSDTKAVTPAALAGGYAGALGATGWMRHPNGMIEQWGNGSHGADGTAPIVFPVPFPNAVFGALATNNASAPAPAAWHGIGNLGLAGMTIFSAVSTGVAPSAAGVASFWRAWGN